MLRALLVVSFLLAAYGAVWTELGTLDCQGHAHLANQNDFLSTDANVFSRLFVYYADFVVDMWRQKAECRCPDLTSDNHDRNFMPGVELLLRAAEEDSAFPLPAACNSSSDPKFEFWFDKINAEFNLPLPSTCSLSTWTNDGKCEFEYPVPGLDVTFQISLSKCPRRLNVPGGNVPLFQDARIPFISVSCTGDGCSDLWKFCDTDNECTGSHKCQPLRIQEREETFKLCRSQQWCVDRNTNCNCQGDPSDPFTECYCLDPDNPASCTDWEYRCEPINEDNGDPKWFRSFDDAYDWRSDRGLHNWNLEYVSQSYVGVDITDKLNDVFLDILKGPRWFNSTEDSCPAFGTDVGLGVANKLFEFFSSAWNGDGVHSSGMKFCGLDKLGLTLTDQEMARSSERHEVENPFVLRGCGKDNPDLESICPCKFNDTLADIGPCNCWPEQPCPHECENNNFWQTCQNGNSPFDAWNGILPNGLGAAASAARKDGSAFESFESVPQDANELVLIRHSCTEQFSIFPNNEISARINLPDFSSVIQHIGGIVKTLAECRDPAIAGNDDLFSALNWPVDMTFALHLLTQGTGWMDLGAAAKTYDTLYSLINNDIDENKDYRPPTNDTGEHIGIELPEMPSTCTLSSWLSQGKCAFEWDGFSELLYDDVGSITLRVEVQECAGEPLGIPEFTVSCVGSKCRETFEFWRVEYCQADNECQASSSGAQRNCNDFGLDIVRGQHSILWNPFGRREQTTKFRFPLKNGLTSIQRDEIEVKLGQEIVDVARARAPTDCASSPYDRVSVSVGPADGRYYAYILISPEIPDTADNCGAYRFFDELRWEVLEPAHNIDQGNCSPNCPSDPRTGKPGLSGLDVSYSFWNEAQCGHSGDCPTDDAEFYCGWTDCVDWEYCLDIDQWGRKGDCALTDSCINYDSMMQHIFDFVGIVTHSQPQEVRSCPGNLNCHGICDPHIVALAREVTDQDSEAWVDKYFRTPDGKKGTLNELKEVGQTHTQTAEPVTTWNPTTVSGGPGGGSTSVSDGAATSTTVSPVSTGFALQYAISCIVAVAVACMNA